MNPPIVELRVLDERIHAWGLPTYASQDAAGIDLFACLAEPLVLPPHSPAQISSGISIHIVRANSPTTAGPEVRPVNRSASRDNVVFEEFLWP